MAAFNFPNNPSINDTYSLNGITYTWTGVAWDILGQEGAQGATGAQGIQGVTGVQGTTGAQGVQGPVGFDGTRIINLVIDGGGVDILSGTIPSAQTKGVIQLSNNANIIGWSMFSHETGNIKVDVYKSNTAAFPLGMSLISGSVDVPTLANSSYNVSTGLSGWNTVIQANSVLDFRVNSSPTTTLTRATLTLKLGS